MMRSSKQNRNMLIRAQRLEDQLLRRYIETCQYAHCLQDVVQARAIKHRLTRVTRLIQRLYAQRAMEKRSSAA